jgi:Ser/Thr protein kinase RdoA (MazF antagonist)
MAEEMIAQQVEECLGLRNVNCECLNTPVNDVYAVTTQHDKYALKIYNAQSRTTADVQWEIALITHLIENGAPVAKPIPHRGSYLQRFLIDDSDRVGVLFEWAAGVKPAPSLDTYRLVGSAAARVHRAADTFTTSLRREIYDAQVLIDEQLSRMRMHLTAAGRWPQSVQLGERLKRAMAEPTLDRGICHMDLSLDNVHITDGHITVFDFDSSGECWRSIEPHGVLRCAGEYFRVWLDGYREIRRFSARDERAVHAFGIIGDLRGVAWKLGVARSSRGTPLLKTADLADVVDGWLAWESGGR